MIRKIIAWYSIFLGVAVMGMWIMILLTETIPEGKVEMSFHLTSEFVMATLCLISGILSLNQLKLAGYLVLMAHSMVIYSVLNAAGYYGQRGDITMVVMFIILLIFSLMIIITQLINE